MSPFSRMPRRLLVVTSGFQEGSELVSAGLLAVNELDSNTHRLSTCCVQSRALGGICRDVRVAPLSCPLGAGRICFLLFIQNAWKPPWV